MIFADWAIRWQIPPAAMADLQTRLLGLDGTPGAVSGKSEAAVQSQVRLEASRKGGRLFRNNVGAGYAEDGAFIRWGLANDSAQVNKVIKSADLIGLRPVLIEQKHVGLVLGQPVTGGIAVTEVGHHLHVVLKFQQAPVAGADDCVVVCQHHPQGLTHAALPKGSRAARRSPGRACPGLEGPTSSWPPSAQMRSRRPASPLP